MWGLGFTLSGAVGCSLGYLNTKNLPVTVTVICIWIGLNALATSGAFIALAEYAPMYAGITISLCNSIGQLAGIAAPSVIKALTVDGTQQQWRIAFLVSAGVYVVGALIFIILGQGGVPDWAKPDMQNERTKLVINTELGYTKETTNSIDK